MFKLLVSASLSWLGVHARGRYFVESQKPTCEVEGRETITDSDECIVDAKQDLGYEGKVYILSVSAYPKGCIAIDGDVYFNTSPSGPPCGTALELGGSWNSVVYMNCICSNGSGAGSGSDEGNVCIDVRKKRACKALEYCNYDRNASPMCTDKDPSAKIPIKEFCEVIHVRGWCKRVEECLWTGAKCMLKSEASCTDVTKRRICQPLRSKNGGCLNGKHCFWTGQYCIETRGASC